MKTKELNSGVMGRQQGASMLTVLAAIFVLLGVVTFMIRLMPAYMDDYAAKRLFSSLEDSGRLEGASVNEIRRMITRRQQTDNLDAFKAEDINLRWEGNLLLVDFVYEVRVPLFGNVDAIMTFEHDYELRGQ